MNKSSLLEHIRNLQRELDSLMDIVIAMEDSEPQQAHLQQDARNDGWLTVRQVCEYLNISQTTFYEGVKSGVFPKGFAFGAKTIRWRMSDIEAYQRRRCAEEISKTPAKKRGRPSRLRKVQEFCYV